MADYTPLIARAVAALKDNSGEARRGVYERARQALGAQLRGMTPALPEEAITRERLSLEEAIRHVEASQAEPPKPAEPEADGAPFLARAAARTLRQAAAAAETLGPATAGAKRAAVVALADKPEPPPPAAEPREPTFDPPAPKPDRAARELDAPPSATAPRVPGPPAPPDADEPRVPASVAEPPGFIRPRLGPAAEALEPAPRKGRGALIAISFALFLIVAGGSLGWYVATNQEAPLRRIAPPPPTPPPVVDAGERPKTADRIGGEPASPPAAPASAPILTPQPTPAPSPPAVVQPAPAPQVAPQITPPPAPQTAPPAAAIAQRAVLFEETPQTQSGAALPGTVIWRTQTVPGGQGQPPDLALLAEVQIPERRIAATITIRRNLDATLPASHTIEVLFALPRDFMFGGVAEVPGLLMKSTEQARGVPLVGQAVRVANGFFFIGLSSFENDRAANVQLMRSRVFIDIPMRYDNGRRAILTLEKGAAGERAFDEAMTAWGQ